MSNAIIANPQVGYALLAYSYIRFLSRVVRDKKLLTKNHAGRMCKCLYGDAATPLLPQQGIGINNMNRLLAMVSLLGITGCASIAGEKLQPISVQTIQDSKEVAGVGCTLANDAGKWFVTTPGSVIVHKSTGDLAVDCSKDGNGVGHETIISKSNGVVWGNVLIGGGIGYIIDRNTGAGFDYPNSITVVLRKIDEAVGLATPPVTPVAQTSSK